MLRRKEPQAAVPHAGAPARAARLQDAQDLQRLGVQHGDRAGRRGKDVLAAVAEQRRAAAPPHIAFCAPSARCVPSCAVLASQVPQRVIAPELPFSRVPVWQLVVRKMRTNTPNAHSAQCAAGPRTAQQRVDRIMG